MEDEELIEGQYIPDRMVRVNPEDLPNAYRVVNFGATAPRPTTTTTTCVNPIIFEEVGNKHSLAKPEDIDEMFS